MKGLIGEDGQSLAEAAKGTQGHGGSSSLCGSYVLSGDTAHYDGVYRLPSRRAELRVIPVFATGLDQRPAIDNFFMKTTALRQIDALVSLSGFSLRRRPSLRMSCEAAEDMLASFGRSLYRGTTRRVPIG